MRKLLLAALLLPALALPAPGQDDDDDYLRAGLWELNLNARAAFTEFDDVGVERSFIAGDVGLGYFIVKWLEMGVFVSGIWQETEFDTTEIEETSVVAAGRLTINLPTGTPFVPFFGAGIGPAWTRIEVNDTVDEDEVGLYWQGFAGARFFVHRRASINLAFLYEQIIYENGDFEDSETFGGMAGLSIYF